MIGEGTLLKDMQDKVRNEKLENNVKFISPKTNVHEYYMAMDLFLLPSVYEGLGIVYIEAQASGLHTFASNVVPIETKVSQLIHYMSLSESPEIWANEMTKYINNFERIDTQKEISECGYNIENEVKNLEEFYESLL